MKKTRICWAAALLLHCAPAVSAEEFRDCPDCPAMVKIPGKSYALGKYEVTFDEWDACVAAGGCNGYKPNDGLKESWGRGKRPVNYVNWDDAQAYVAWLSKKTGKSYRLPGADEWEYACYGGTRSDYCGGNDVNQVGWYSANSGDQSHPVGQKQANGYGLFDMTGNVWEWTSKCWEGSCGDSGGPSADVVAKYLAAKPKPQLPEEARKYRVQAEFAVQRKEFGKALELYGEALEIAPWWPEGHYNRAVILGEQAKYREAISEMRWYLKLSPKAPDARAAQDMIYKWESVADEDPGKSGLNARRLVYGGSWYVVPMDIRSAASWADASNRDSETGFRVARTLP